MNVVMIINVIIQTNKAIYLPIRAVHIISFGFDLENSNNFDTGNFDTGKDTGNLLSVSLKYRCIQVYLHLQTVMHS